jgi:hypothetical protein
MRNVKIENLKALSLGEGWERLSPVDEENPAGSYEIEWNATSLPSRQGSALTSGVYFYLLRVTEPESSLPDGKAGSVKGFVETKKMLLLK